MKKLLASLLLATVLISGCSLFKKSPQAAVNDGLSKFAEVKKITSILSMNGTITPPTQEKTPTIQFSLTMNSKSDVLDSKSPKVDNTMKISATADGKTIAADMLVRLVDKKFYANLTNLDVSGDAGAAIKTQLKDLFSTWWFFPVQDGRNPAVALAAKRAQIVAKFKDVKFFVNAEEQGSEMIGGVSTMKYRVDIDKASVKQFLVDLINTTADGEKDGSAKMTAEEEKQLEEGLQNVDFSGAVWVGEDEIVHQIKGTLTVRAKDPAQDLSVTMDISYTATDYGKDVAVSVPEGAKEFNSIALFPLLGAFSSLKTPTAVTDDATTKVVPGATTPAATPPATPKK